MTTNVVIFFYCNALINSWCANASFTRPAMALSTAMAPAPEWVTLFPMEQFTRNSAIYHWVPYPVANSAVSYKRTLRDAVLYVPWRRGRSRGCLGRHPGC